MATVVVTGMFGLAVAIKASASHQGIVRTSNEAAIAAEHIEMLPYRPCTSASSPTAATYQGDLGSVVGYNPQTGLEVKLDVEAIGFLQSATAANPTFASTCPVGGDQGLQRIVVRVDTIVDGRRLSGTVPFIKRDERCGTSAGLEEQQC